MSCCGQRAPGVARQPQPDRKPGSYLVVARRTATDGKRFSTLTAAQDFARRSGGIVRQL